MDINRLREFLVLSEQLNYSKAANILFITQPVLSRHIRDLEEDLGGQLFVRDTHNVSLTEFGELCAAQLGDVVKTWDSSFARIRNAADTSADALSVGFLDYAVRPFLTQFASWFDTAHDNIEIDYSSGNLDDLTDALIEDKLDLAFLTSVGSDSQQIKDLESELIYKDPLIAVFHASNPLSKKDSITLAEVSTCPLIVFSQTNNPYTHAFHKRLFDEKGLFAQPVKEVKSIESGLFYAKSGLGVFIIPQHLSSLVDDLCTVPISDDDCFIPLNLVWKKQNPKRSIQTYVHEFKAFYQNI